MGNNSYETEPNIEQKSDVQLYPKKRKGILIMTDNGFWIRLWFAFSNPFRYVFTGKLRY
jgi:hypothetical protein